MIYYYTKENRIFYPNTYFYTEFHGVKFFSAFDENRKIFLGTNDCYKEPSLPDLSIEKTQSEKSVETFTKLEHLFYQVLTNSHDPNMYAEIEIFRKKFEVTKKIYKFYDENWKPINKEEIYELSLYLRLAQIFEAVYSSGKKLIYLNVLLKIIDSLISVRSDLSKEQRENVSWLILREKKHIDELKKLHIAVE